MFRLVDPREHFLALREIVSLLTRHRQLTWEMTKREITDRYAGQVFGTIWAVGHPLILMGIYVSVFCFIFRMQMGGTEDMPFDYAAYLLSGLIPWMTIQDAMAKSSTVIIGHASLVKQVVFPIDVLPVKTVLASFITQFISCALLLVYIFARYHYLHWTCLLLPLLFVIQAFLMIGVAYVLAAVGVYFRDAKDFVQVFCLAGMYVMPIFYLPASVPWMFKPVLYLNPFSYVIWCFQDVLYFGRFAHPWAWGVFLIMSPVVFILGYRLFRKLKTMFGNVL